MGTRVTAAILMAYFLGAELANADLIVPSTTAVASFCMSITESSGGCEIAQETQIVSNGTASINGSFGSAAVQSQLTTSLKATSGYGVLKAGGSSTFNISGTPKFTTTNATTDFVDVMTVNFAPFTGQEGLMFLNYTLDGTLSGTLGVTSASAVVSIGLGTEFEQQSSTFFDSPICPPSCTPTTSATISGTFRVPKTFTFTYGTPFGLSFQLDTGTRGDFGSGTAVADFSDTLVLSGLIVTDQFGNPVPGATFSAASGTQYTQDGVVPEPSSLLLLMTALSGMALTLKKHRQRFSKTIPMR